MKKDFRLNRLFVYLMMMGCSLGFVACDDDDEPAVPSTAEAWGEFKGDMLVNMVAQPTEAEGEAPEAIAVAATVKNDTIYFDAFPVSGLIASLVPADQVDALVEAIGEVSYKVGYKPALNADATQIEMTLDPKPLLLSIPLGEETVLSVEVTVSAAEKGSYVRASKALDFTFRADEVKLDGKALDEIPALDFAFSMEKK